METTAENNQTVTGLFEHAHQAEQFYQAVLGTGIKKDAISIAMSEQSHKKHFALGALPGSEKTHLAGDAGRGALLGGATGGIATAIAAIATNLVLPGIGLVFIGPLLAGLAGAAAGGAIGAMVGYGFPKEQAISYHEGIQKGNILISVVPDNEQQRETVETLFNTYGGTAIYVGASGAPNAE
ncbi:DUF1269 domain-containing protein [Dyadobacter sp. MSC1_007]|jgi:outer membrane lipoprotein SlyB|uniref:DUF1269 domain-containing protein n=1 Tax=Dyadobacter sp. MSC1_007 TaxID=2909264 RepID=UPI00202F7365|nr:DUF1269 domain-containing protein [Dyadobacter sp. MSC1_007]